MFDKAFLLKILQQNSTLYLTLAIYGISYLITMQRETIIYSPHHKHNAFSIQSPQYAYKFPNFTISLSVKHAPQDKILFDNNFLIATSEGSKNMR